MHSLGKGHPGRQPPTASAGRLGQQVPAGDRASGRYTSPVRNDADCLDVVANCYGCFVGRGPRRLCNRMVQRAAAP